MNGNGDLPYYNGRPVQIQSIGWLAMIGSVVVAFLLLILLPFDGFPLVFIPAILFTGIPLLTLAAVTGGHHTALFRRVGLREIGLMIGFAIMSMVLSVVVGFIIGRFVPMTSNPNVGGLVNAGAFDIIVFMARTFIQLIGEELLTILPLLAVLWLCVTHLKLSRHAGLIIAVIISTLWFSLVHLPTYGWNIIQCIAVIGTPRLVLTMAFLLTRNLWVCGGAHILNDWTEFLLPNMLQAFGHLPIGTGG